MFVHFCIKEKMAKVYDFFFVFDYIFYRYIPEGNGRDGIKSFQKRGDTYFYICVMQNSYVT